MKKSHMYMVALAAGAVVVYLLVRANRSAQAAQAQAQAAAAAAAARPVQAAPPIKGALLSVQPPTKKKASSSKIKSALSAFGKVVKKSAKVAANAGVSYGTGGVITSVPF